jgi:hypothetical protein
MKGFATAACSSFFSFQPDQLFHVHDHNLSSLLHHYLPPLGKSYGKKKTIINQTKKINTLQDSDSNIMSSCRMPFEKLCFQKIGRSKKILLPPKVQKNLTRRISRWHMITAKKNNKTHNSGGKTFAT